ncbi:hypothetical protein [Paenibacillus macerans]|uniref:hypothetical protein n=1 Tax=Paenibacillus macerans TaxID=44252 RepID=UPI003D31C8A8
MTVERELLQSILKKASQRARQQAKQAGASIYYIRNNRRIREDADGNKFEIIFDPQGKRTERKYFE